MKLLAIVLLVIPTILCAKVVEQVKTVKPYSKLTLAGEIDATLQKGDANKVVIKGEEAVIAKVKLVNDGKELAIVVEYEEDDGSQKLEVIVYQNKLEELSVAGASSFKGELAPGKELELGLAGASTADLKVDFKELNVSLAGAAKLGISGKAQDLDLSSAGASVVSGLDLKTEEASISAIGASNVSIHVTKKLSANSIGASTVKYRGSPKVSETAIGASSVIKVK